MPDFSETERHREDLLDASYTDGATGSDDDPRCAVCDEPRSEHEAGYCPTDKVSTYVEPQDV